MSGRGTYGTPLHIGSITVDGNGKGSSWGPWLLGGLVVVGAVLWAKRQSGQIDKLYAATGLPHQSFVEALRARSKELSGAAREKIHALTQRFGTKKEA